LCLMESTTPKYRYPDFREWVNCNYNHAFCFEKHDLKTGACKSFVLATLDVTDPSGQWSQRQRRVFLAMAGEGNTTITWQFPL
jgi:hypothetical protein